MASVDHTGLLRRSPRCSVITQRARVQQRPSQRPPPFLHVPPRALWLECGPVEKKKRPPPSFKTVERTSAVPLKPTNLFLRKHLQIFFCCFLLHFFILFVSAWSQRGRRGAVMLPGSSRMGVGAPPGVDDKGMLPVTWGITKLARRATSYAGEERWSP